MVLQITAAAGADAAQLAREACGTPSTRGSSCVSSPRHVIRELRRARHAVYAAELACKGRAGAARRRATAFMCPAGSALVALVVGQVQVAEIFNQAVHV